MIGTRILKINLEIHSWDNGGQSWQPSFRNLHFAITERQKDNFHVNFDLNYLSYFQIDFQNSYAYHVENFLNFSKTSQLLQFALVEADKRANNQVGTVLLDTLYNPLLCCISIVCTRSNNSCNQSSARSQFTVQLSGV